MTVAATVDPDDPTPPYEQLRRQLAGYITTGELPAGTRLSPVRQLAADLDLANLAPAEAIRRLVEFTFEYDEAHPDFIRLVAIENIHRGEHLRKVESLRDLSRPVASLLDDALERGRDCGEFRADVDALRAAGTRVILSIGGQGGHVDLSSPERTQEFLDSVPR